MRQITACFLAAAILAAGGTPDARGAAPATRPRKTRPLLGGVMFPRVSLDAKYPTAIILEPTSDKPETFVTKWRSRLVDSGFCVFQTRAPEDGWKGPDGPRLVKEFDKLVEKGNAGKAWAIAREVDPNRTLIVARRDGGSAAISMIEKYPKRIAGALMISVSPWVHKPQSIRLWRPSRNAWSIPIWAVIPVNIKNGAPTLLLWRRIAAEKPLTASLTLDPRLVSGDTEPDRSISKWISAIAGGKNPAPGPDSQVLLETRRYKAPAKRLLAAMQVAGPADAGEKFTKTEGPMVLGVTAPDKWRRGRRGERKYDRDEMPYVQIYLSPRPGSMLFARATAARWDADANGLLDQYEKRLADGGFLVVRYSRWQAKGYSLQISSILWPTRGKWHRWLVLAAAGPGRKNAPAAPMVLVMDASDIPDVNAMAAAMKRILTGISVTWKGEPKQKK